MGNQTWLCAGDTMRNCGSQLQIYETPQSKYSIQMAEANSVIVVVQTHIFCQILKVFTFKNIASEDNRCPSFQPLYNFEVYCNFELQTGFYSNTVFQSYNDYIVNDETYSLDKIATGQYQRVTIYQRQLKSFEKNSLVQIYSSDWKHRH